MPSCCTPGHTVTLQPGEYVLTLVDSLSDRHIVRIFDKDQQNVITTILAIPNYRLQPCNDSSEIFQRSPVVTLRSGMSALRLALWDEDRQRMVRFRDVTNAERISHA